MSTTPLQFSAYPTQHRATYDLAALKPLKPPIYNPYDKFSQPEFDAWIGDLTNALKGALGRFDDTGHQPSPTSSESGHIHDFADNTAEVGIDDSVDDEVEYSFVDIKARRVIRKGKARDPREGPGFGTGTGEKHQPIEIGSDSEEAEDGGESEEGSEQWETEQEEGEEEEEEEEESDEEEDQSWLQGESSIQARIRSEGDGVNHFYEDGDENDEEYDQYEEEDVEYEAVARAVGRGSPEEAILLTSDGGPEGDADLERQDVVALDDFDEHSDRSNVEGALTAISHPMPLVANGIDEYATASLGGELEYPSDSHEVAEVDLEDAQPEDEDTSFPSPTILPTVSHQLVNIPDPWSGPKTYAEDFYSGGDVRVASDVQLIADRLGMCDDGDDRSTPQPVTSAGDNTLARAGAERLLDLIDVDFNQAEETAHEEPVIAEDDVFKTHFSFPASLDNVQAIDVSELYGDMEVDIHNEEPAIETDLSTVGASRLLNNAASFASDVPPARQMHSQEETCLDPSELLLVEGRLEVHAIEIQEPVATVVETVAPLATRDSDLVYDVKTFSPPVVLDQEDFEEIPSSSPKAPDPADAETSEGSSNALPQHLSYIVGGLLTPELDLNPPPSFDGDQAALDDPDIESVHHVMADSLTDMSGQGSLPPTMQAGTEVDDLAATSPNGDAKNRLMSIAEHLRKGETPFPDNPLMGTEQSSPGTDYGYLTSTQGPGMTSEMRSQFPIMETPLIPQASAISNDPMNYPAIDSGSPVGTIQSDMPVTTTAVVVENSEVSTPFLGNDRPNAPLELCSDFVAKPTDADVADQLASPQHSRVAVSAGLDPSHLVDVPVAFEASSNWATLGDVKGRPTNEDHSTTADNREILQAAVHSPAPLSLAYTHSQSTPSGSYSMRMVMRKATDPVLFVDPYPYSLSTPGQTQDEGSDDDETEQENSFSSSSTPDKYSDDKVKKNEVDLTFSESAQRNQSPSEPVEVDKPGAGALGSPEYIEGSVPEQNHADSDTDADGDVDPEFVEFDPTPSSTRSSSTNDFGVAEDPFADTDVKGSMDRGDNMDVRPSGVKERHEPTAKPQDSSTSDKTPSPVATSTTTPPTSRSASELPAILIIKKKPALVEQIRNNENNGMAESTGMGQPSDIPTSVLRSSKRKRDWPPDARHLSFKRRGKNLAAYQELPTGRKALELQVQEHSAGKNKGKRRASQPQSHNTSRASSIVSSAPSDKSSQSLYMHPSPTVDKDTALRPQMPPPLLHTHLRTIPHHHGLPSAIPQRSIQKSNSTPRHGDSRPPASPSSHLGPSHRSSSFSSSPVTRSHCRYHKISIPKYEDDGPREFFLVPGCSLGNRELIAEELIQDHGDATPEDADRSVNDIVSLQGLNPYLVGIMRQLVGLDRDQEVYYVPSHGEEPVRNPGHKTPSDKLALGRVPSHDLMIIANAPGTLGSPRTSIASARSPVSSKAPVSTSGSACTSTSFPRKEANFDPLSALSCTESDLSNEDGSPRLMLARHSFREDKFPAATSSPNAPKNPRKKGTKKRTRTSEILGEPVLEHPKLKKQKTHTSDGRATTVAIPPR